MSKKKLEVVELNKKEEKIILEQEQSSWILSWKKYNKLILLILLILSLAMLTTGIIAAIFNVSPSEKLIIKQVSVDTNLDVSTDDITANPSSPMTEETAKEMFKKSGKFKRNGQVLLVKIVNKGQYVIKFYSDFTAIKIMKDGNFATKIKAIDEKTYGIKENGVINSKAETIDITKTNEKKYSWGTVIYYSDGSAEVISDSKKTDIYVRNAKEITDDYISENKISYLKETNNINGIKLNYYYDGTIEVIKNNKSYLVRDKNDLDIKDKDVIFKNENEATIMKSVKLDDGKTIDYYTDGGAIIRDGNKTLSVRKSNSIIIKNNKIFEIVDNIYVTVSQTKNNGNIIYYTNGSAVIKNYNGKTIYIKDNSDIKYKDGRIVSVGNDYENLTEQRVVGTDKILQFETTAVVETDKFIAIVPKDNIIYDSDGSLKDIVTNEGIENDKPITITNSTNDVIKYRLVIEKSNRTTLDPEYIRYQLSVGNEYIGPSKLNKNIWNQDIISDSISVTGLNYILIEKTLEPTATDEIRLMLWTDYDTIPNAMQNTYFYGTLRIYAWQEIKVNI